MKKFFVLCGATVVGSLSLALASVFGLVFLVLFTVGLLIGRIVF